MFIDCEEIESSHEWLDVIFAKYVDSFEAACCLAGYSKYDEEVLLSSESTQNNKIILSPESVRRLYDIVKTWPATTAPMLWYVEQALTLLSNSPFLNLNLLIPKFTENEFRKKQILKNYPAIAKYLKLTRINNKAQEPETWKKHARKIYQLLKPKYPKQSDEQLSHKVYKEMKTQHDSGKKGLTKRGGKSLPNASTILRHAINKPNKI